MRTLYTIRYRLAGAAGWRTWNEDLLDREKALTCAESMSKSRYYVAVQVLEKKPHVIFAAGEMRDDA